MLLFVKINNANIVLADYFDGVFYDVTKYMTNSRMIDTYNTFLLVKDSNFKVPYLSVTSMQSNYIDFTAFYNEFLRVSDDSVFDKVMSDEDQVKGLISSLVGILKVNIDDNAIYKLRRAVLNLNAYLKNEIIAQIDIPNDYIDIQAIDYVKKMKKDSMRSVPQLSTLFREKATDKLSIEIPTVTSLIHEVESYTPLDDVFRPFLQDPLLNSYHYKYLKSQYGLDTDDIIGSIDNISSEIYPEEMDYYNALVELHRACMMHEFKGYSVEMCENGNVASPLFLEYMKSVITDAIAYHWNHGGYLPFVTNTGEDKFNADGEEIYEDFAIKRLQEMGFSVEGSSEEGAVGDIYLRDATILRNPSDPLNNYDRIFPELVLTELVVNQSAIDCHFSIKLYIQLLRFGSRKPRKISLADGRYFDPLTFTITKKSGNYSKYVTKMTPSGKKYTPCALVTTSGSIRDNIFISTHKLDSTPFSNLPVGMVVVENFEEPASDEIRLIYMSFIDLIENLDRDTSVSIEGLSLNKGKIVVDKNLISESIFQLSPGKCVDLNTAVLEIEGDADLVHSMYTSTEFKKVLIENLCNDKKLSNLSILSRNMYSHNINLLSQYYVDSQEELDSSKDSTRIPSEKYIVSKVAIDMLFSVMHANGMLKKLAETTFENDLQQVISSYEAAIGVYNYRGGIFAEESQTHSLESTENVVETSVFVEDINKIIEEDTDIMSINFTKFVGVPIPKGNLTAYRCFTTGDDSSEIITKYNETVREVITPVATTSDGINSIWFYVVLYVKDGRRVYYVTFDKEVFTEVTKSPENTVVIKQARPSAFNKLMSTIHGAVVNGTNSSVEFGTSEDYRKFMNIMFLVK